MRHHLEKCHMTPQVCTVCETSVHPERTKHDCKTGLYNLVQKQKKEIAALKETIKSMEKNSILGGPTSITCDKGHQLKLHTTALLNGQRTGLYCEDCPEMIDIAKGYYNCGNVNTCDFDLCPSCLKKRETKIGKACSCGNPVKRTQ